MNKEVEESRKTSEMFRSDERKKKLSNLEPKSTVYHYYIIVFV